MSWIRDEGGAVLNLDCIEKVEILEIEHDEGETPDPARTHVVRCYFTPNTNEITAWLFVGTEAECVAYLDRFCKAVHMVKV